MNSTAIIIIAHREPTSIMTLFLEEFLIQKMDIIEMWLMGSLKFIREAISV